MKFIPASLWSLVAVTFRAFGSLISQKLFAVYFGASGVGLWAHFQNLISMVTHVPNDGINRGLIRFWANKEESVVDKHKFVLAAILWHLLTLGLFMGVFFFHSDYLFNEFGGKKNNSWFYTLFWVAMPILLIKLFFQSLFLADQRMRVYSLVDVFTSVLLVLFLWLVVDKWPLEKVFIAFLFGQSGGVIFCIYFLFQYRHIDWKKLKWSLKSFKALGHYLLMAASGLFFGKFVSFWLRDFSIEAFGLVQTGYWQAVVKISDLYKMLFVATVGTVVYPQLSGLIHDLNKLRAYLWEVILKIIPLTLTGLLLVYFGRGFLLEYLFTTEFREAGKFIPWQLAGDFFHFLVYLLMYVISVQGRAKSYIFIQGLGSALYLSLAFFLSSKYGIMGFPRAEFFIGVISFLLCIWFNRNWIKWKAIPW
ncbi:oligosaccharide flippase family protein [Xanthovirga aplysinae]|uniref:oligosaccharide flippase family protein n=1 Tax=Xanthovirga aplysinae TaxID=2529853 RepID=UPI0012BCB40F|nr:oligosaccharide flippase family protein [Xanthovirga aplysinae]MTI29825.1 hypothetical protein [Xanthovirga aplysinae]